MAAYYTLGAIHQWVLEQHPRPLSLRALQWRQARDALVPAPSGTLWTGKGNRSTPIWTKADAATLVKNLLAEL